MDEGIQQRAYNIRGRVQGVFFRAWTRDTAMELRLRGTVKNLPDGSVEAHAAGLGAALDLFQEKLWEGPPSSMVEGVEVGDSDVEIPTHDFRILY